MRQACGKAGRMLEGMHSVIWESLAQNIDYGSMDLII